MTDRRSFIQSASQFCAGLWAFPLIDTGIANEITSKLSALESCPDGMASNEDFWSWVSARFSVSGDIINLNNGGVSPHPLAVQQAVERFTAMSNEAPSYYMWRVFEKGRETIREKLAELAGVSPEEIAICRNTTEALDTAIFGMDMSRGDEFVVSNFIYPNMDQAWKQRELREGLVRKTAKLPMPSTDTSDLVAAYTAQFTKKTKAVLIEQVINWTGQVMPVAEIAAEARKRGITVLVDGAHGFAHLNFKISDLQCDFYATSLHKWLCAPFGTGMLWMRKDRIADHWALFPGPNPQSSDIRKFEAQGTRDVPAELAIGQAIDFHNAIGSKRKFERLHFLKQYWVERVKGKEGIRFWCPEDSTYSGALTTFSIDGISGEAIHNHLWKEGRIHTTVIRHEGIDGVRITPHIYTRTDDLDRLIRLIHEV